LHLIAAAAARAPGFERRAPSAASPSPTTCYNPPDAPTRSTTNVETARRQPHAAGPPRALRIAIDGPSASGKSAAGSLVAQQLGYRFVDTGAMYRAITWLALERSVDPGDSEALARLAAEATMAVDVAAGPEDHARVLVNGLDATPHLREPVVEAAVSQVSAVPEVRAAMVAIQRRLAAEGAAVMAGRDIGTVVLPDAELKVYLDASVDERARRRAAELQSKGVAANVATVRDELARRDAYDSGRAVSPLRPADDAERINTDGLTLDQVVERVLELARCR
jgi:cytidylate kinase